MVLIGALCVGSPSDAEGESAVPARRDDTPTPKILFFTLAAVVEFRPTRAVPAPLSADLYAGVTSSVGARVKLASLPPFHKDEPGTKFSTLAVGAGAGLETTLLDSRVARGPTLRLSLFGYERDDRGDRAIPSVDLHAFASLWMGAEDLGPSWQFVWGNRVGIGLTAMAWSRYIAGVFCNKAGLEGIAGCLFGAVVWGPLALFNHAEVFADMVKYPAQASGDQPLTPRLGVAFGFGL